VPILYDNEAALSAANTAGASYPDHALAETVDNSLLWLLDKASVLTVSGAVLTATPAGRWILCGSRSRSVDVDVPFATGDSSAYVDVAATWARATSQMSYRWSLQEDTATKNTEEAAAEGFRVSFTNIVAGVGFRLLAFTDYPSNGTFRVRVTGEIT